VKYERLFNLEWWKIPSIEESIFWVGGSAFKYKEESLEMLYA
jgi:hypothetical protein